MKLTGAVWAVGVVTAALFLAVFVYQRHTWVANPTKVCAGGAFPTCAQRHPGWEDPVAALIALGGVAVGGRFLIAGAASPRRVAVARSVEPEL